MSDWKQKVEAAHQMVSDLCHKRREWIMSVPARRDYDPDLVIAEGLSSATTKIARLEAENAELRTRVVHSRGCDSRKPSPIGGSVRQCSCDLGRLSKDSEQTLQEIALEIEREDAARDATIRRLREALEVTWRRLLDRSRHIGGGMNYVQCRTAAKMIEPLVLPALAQEPKP